MSRHGAHNGWCRVSGIPTKAEDCTECLKADAVLGRILRRGLADDREMYVSLNAPLREDGGHSLTLDGQIFRLTDAETEAVRECLPPEPEPRPAIVHRKVVSERTGQSSTACGLPWYARKDGREPEPTCPDCITQGG